MAFVVKALFVSALVCAVNAGNLHHGDHGHHDSFLSSALNSPSASFGPPSRSYGPPAPSSHIHHHHHSSGNAVTVEETLIEDHGPVVAGASLPGVGGIVASGISHGSNIQYGGSHSHGHGSIGGGISHGISGPSHISAPAPVYGVPSSSSGSLISGPSASGPISGPGLPYPSTDLSAPGASGAGGPYSEGSLILDSTLPGSNGQIGGQSATVGAPRVIGTSVSVGRPEASATRYELQSVVQNVVRRIPVEITRHIQVAVPQPVPVPVRQEIRVPVPQPYPVHVDVVKQVPYPVYKTEHVSVERPVPYEVVKEVPVEVIRKVHVPVDRPYEVIRKVHVPVEKHVEVPVVHWKPYPLHIIKHVTHYKKKSCCW